jgi:hypothetical protein
MRRAIETGAHVEATLPMVAHRQWTLSLPRAVRLSVLKAPGLFKLVEKALVRAVWWWQRPRVVAHRGEARPRAQAVAREIDGERVGAMGED